MIETLKRFLRRTERDVALAGVMVGSVSAMAKLFPVVERYRTLRVHFYPGGYTSWEAWRDDGGEPVEAFRDFLRWYHGRPQSDCFVMRGKGFEQMFRRCDIRSYEIASAERYKPSAASGSGPTQEQEQS